MIRYEKIKSNDGFTLIEVIVVLVIIAILISLAIPFIFGYISKAQARSCDVNCRNLYYEMALSFTSRNDLTQESADEILAGLQPVCPSGGNVTVEVNNKTIKIECSKHGELSQENNSDSEFCQSFLQKYTSYIDSLSIKDNTNARLEFFNNLGGFPTMTSDVSGSNLTYQIEPYYNKNTGEYWLIAKKGDGTSINAGNFYADMVYDPTSNKWYQHLHSYTHKPDSAAMTFSSLSALQESVANTDSWREVKPIYNL